MKKIFYLLIAVFLISSCKKDDSDANKKCYLSKIHYNNNSYTEYVYNNDMKVVRINLKDSIGNIYSHYDYEYSNGKAVKEMYFYPNDSLTSVDLYSYEGNNLRLVKGYLENFDNLSKLENYRTEYIYDAYGKVVKIIDYRYSGSSFYISSQSEFEYDAKGNIVKTKGLNSNNEYISETTYIYDDKKNYQSFYPKTPFSQNANNYTSVKYVSKTDNSINENFCAYTYNKSDYPAQVTVTNSNNNNAATYSFEYSYK